jgi:hypothetical protein
MYFFIKMYRPTNAQVDTARLVMQDLRTDTAEVRHDDGVWKDISHHPLCIIESYYPTRAAKHILSHSAARRAKQSACLRCQS